MKTRGRVKKNEILYFKLPAYRKMDNFLCFPTYWDNINILISILASLSFFNAIVLHSNTGTVSHGQKVSYLSAEIHSLALTIAGTQSSSKINRLFHEW